MSQERTPYTMDGEPTLKEISQRPCARLFKDPGYVPPTWKDLRDLMAATGWKGADVAEITGAASTPQAGSRTVRKWTANPEQTTEARNISYAAWRLLLIEAGVFEESKGGKR